MMKAGAAGMKTEKFEKQHSQWANHYFDVFGTWSFWPVKSPFWSDNVRQRAIILSPASFSMY